jgi:hypothetical protein
MRDVSESQGARLMVMVVPTATSVAQRGGAGENQADDDGDTEDRDDVTPGFEDPHARLAELVDRAGLVSLDLLSPLRRADNRVKERLYYRRNSHWTAAGHAVVADELYSFMVERGLTTPRVPE